MMKASTRLVAWILFGGAIAGGLVSAQNRDLSNRVREAIDDSRARNIMLFVGDGLGDSEITLARNYAVGAAARLALDTLPYTGAYTTYSIEERDRRCPTTSPIPRRPERPGPPAARPVTAGSRRRPAPIRT